MTTQTEKANGTDELAVKAAVEHHVSSYQRVVSERDDLQRKSDKQEQMLTVAKIENEGLRSELAVERSRTASYQNERDAAVENVATYKVLFISFQAQMRAFEIENAPFIKSDSNHDGSAT